MTESHGSMVGRWRLRTELRRLRETKKLTQPGVARKMEWSLSKVVRIELGVVGISANDLRALLALYGVEEPGQIEAMLELARSSRRRAWWSAYRDDLNTDYLQYIAFEAEASRAQFCAPLVLPGLVQTEDYARTIIRKVGVREPAPERVERLVQVRTERQQQVIHHPPPAKISLVLGESAVRQVIGGETVMQQQLLHLLDLARLPHVDLNVIPYGAGAHPGLQGHFTLLEFGDDSELWVLYIDGMEGQSLHWKDEQAREQAKDYQAMFGRLQDLAIGPEGSRALIEKIAGELAR